MTVLAFLLTAFVAIAMGVLLGRAMRPAPEPKRFGLGEAEAATRYISKRDQAGTVLGVVCGVLGYENTVAADVRSATEDLREHVAFRDGEAAEKTAHIEELQRQIADLSYANTRAAERIDTLQKMAETFAG